MNWTVWQSTVTRAASFGMRNFDMWYQTRLVAKVAKQVASENPTNCVDFNDETLLLSCETSCMSFLIRLLPTMTKQGSNCCKLQVESPEGEGDAERDCQLSCCQQASFRPFVLHFHPSWMFKSRKLYFHFFSDQQTDFEQELGATKR